ncbi:hypothetical protein GCM10012275_24170 [Longimycelium tulufanense]|uniref:Uncharacterized protein n=1 Tax=Longimycelium tulufanense TaxID=907463 RepID=A0A8J3C850_9PSEU|nr:hypothetical protein [Longimycelium tulufanense]GGM52386.1 hypothetical protein GCM10012275_24170 [Longimycelium tulufanense]
MSKINAEVVHEVEDVVGEPARLVPEAALRDATLVLDALAAILRAVPTGPVNKPQVTAEQVRAIVAALENGRRIERPCCTNPWRDVLETHLRG